MLAVGWKKRDIYEIVVSCKFVYFLFFFFLFAAYFSTRPILFVFLTIMFHSSFVFLDSYYFAQNNIFKKKTATTRITFLSFQPSDITTLAYKFCLIGILIQKLKSRTPRIVGVVGSTACGSKSFVSFFFFFPCFFVLVVISSVMLSFLFFPL